ncbi:MAG: DUF2877 domain-containing protein [Chloroflexi bacterium]|nr:DUF2877 domain-containing protein [Chloroflexota bacterium]
MTSFTARSAEQTAARGRRPPLVFEALSYGPGVREFLSRPRLSSEVVAVFRRVLYLREADGGMVCIAHEDAHDAPLTIRAAIPRQFDFNDFGISTGMLVGRATENELHIGGRVALVMSDAAEWRPAKVVASATAEQVLDGLRRVSFELGKRAPAIGLAPLVVQVESLVSGTMLRPTPDLGLLHAALPAVELLARSVRLCDMRGVDAAVKGLLGLGPGLTPSGDDFLCGFVAAGMATMKAFSPDSIRSLDFDGAMSGVAESISVHAAGMTTEVSASFLKFAIQGIASSAVHDLIVGLLDAGDEVRSLSAAWALTEIGHSSGWDCLLGTLLGMHLRLALHTDGQAVEGLDISGRRTRP